MNNRDYLKGIAVSDTTEYLNKGVCVPLQTIDGELSIMRSVILNLYESVDTLERTVTNPNRVLSEIRSGNDAEPETVAQEMSMLSARIGEIDRRVSMIGEITARQLNGKKLE